MRIWTLLFYNLSNSLKKLGKNLKNSQNCFQFFASKTSLIRPWTLIYLLKMFCSADFWYLSKKFIQIGREFRISWGWSYVALVTLYIYNIFQNEFCLERINLFLLSYSRFFVKLSEVPWGAIEAFDNTVRVMIYEMLIKQNVGVLVIFYYDNSWEGLSEIWFLFEIFKINICEQHEFLFCHNEIGADDCT